MTSVAAFGALFAQPVGNPRQQASSFRANNPISNHFQTLEKSNKESSQGSFENKFENESLSVFNYISNSKVNKFLSFIAEKSLIFSSLFIRNEERKLTTAFKQAKAYKRPLNSILEKIFLPKKDKTSFAFQALLAHKISAQQDESVALFLYNMCLKFDMLYHYLTQTDPLPGAESKASCLEQLKKENLTETDRKFYSLRYHVYCVKEFIEKFFLEKANQDSPDHDIHSYKKKEGISSHTFLGLIEHSEQSVKDLDHLEKGVSVIKRDDLFACSAKGTGLNVAWNLSTDLGPVKNAVIDPMVLERNLSNQTSAYLSNYVESPVYSLIGGILFTLWRDKNRVPRVEDVKAEKHFQSLFLSKMIERYHQCDAENKFELSWELLEQTKKYNPDFPIERYKKKLDTQTIEGDEKIFYSSSIAAKALKLQLNKIKAQLDSVDNIKELRQKINSLKEHLTKSSLEFLLLSLKENKNESQPLLISEVIIELFEEKEAFDHLLILLNTRFNTSNSDFNREFDQFIHNLLDRKYQDQDITQIISSVSQFRKELLSLLNKKIQFLIHQNIFKTSRRKIFKYDKSRGSLFSQIFQLYKKTKNTAVEEEFRQLIEWELSLLPKLNEAELTDDFLTMHKNFSQVSWEDREQACKEIEKRIKQILNSQLPKQKKDLILRCLKENLNEGLASPAGKVEERRKSFHTELAVGTIGFQTLNLSTYLSPLGGSAVVGAGQTGLSWAVLMTLAPMLEFLSTTSTTTKESLMTLLDGAMKYNQTGVEQTTDNLDLQTEISKLHRLLDEKEKVKTTDGINKLCTEVFSIFGKIEPSLLPMLLEHKHQRKTYLLFELMSLMPQPQFLKLMQLYFPKESLSAYLGGNCLDQIKTATQFTDFLNQEIQRFKFSKKESAFVAIRGMAFLTYLHAEIDDMPTQTKEEKLAKGKKIELYQACKRRFENLITKAYEDKSSAFRTLARVRRRSSIFIKQTAPRFLGGFLYGVTSSLLFKAVVGVAVFGLAITGIVSGWGLVLGISLAAIFGITRIILATWADRPNALYSKSTNTHQLLKAQLEKLPHFERRPIAVNLSSEKSLKDKLRFQNNDFLAKLQQKQYNTLELFTQLKERLDELLQYELGALPHTQQLKDELNLLIEQTREQKIAVLFKQLKVKFGLGENAPLLDKSHLLLNSLQAIRLAMEIELSPLEKIELLFQFFIEIDNQQTTLGQLKKENSFTREKNFYAMQIIAGGCSIFGLLANMFIPGLTSMVELSVPLIISAATLGDHLNSRLASTTKYDSPYGNTQSSQQLKSLLQNLMLTIFLSEQDSILGAELSEEERMQKQALLHNLRKALQTHHSRIPSFGFQTTHIKVYKASCAKAGVEERAPLLSGLVFT